MKKLLFIIVFASVIFTVNASGQTSTVKAIGNFNALKWSKSEDPHAKGYAVDLYVSDRDGKVFGKFLFSPGSIEVTPSQIFDVKWDSALGLISFKAKSSCCSEYEQGPSSPARPSRELFIFNGRIYKNKLVGSLEQRDGYKLGTQGKVISVQLKKEKNISIPASYEDWLATAPPVVNW